MGIPQRSQSGGDSGRIDCQQAAHTGPRDGASSSVITGGGELTNNLEPEERTTVEFYKLVRGCEDVLWAQNTEYIKSMQEALKDVRLKVGEGIAGWVAKNVRFLGHFLRDRQLLLESTVVDAVVRESPGFTEIDQQPYFVRRLQIGPSTREQRLRIGRLAGIQRLLLR